MKCKVELLSGRSAVGSAHGLGPWSRWFESSRPDWAEVSAGIAQLVERHLAKVDVAGSSPVSRSQQEVCVTINSACSSGG